MEEIGEKMKKKIIVKIIITQMDDAIKIIENYYDIANDIISKYEKYICKKTHHIAL